MSPLGGFSSYGSFDWSRGIKQISNVSDQADYYYSFERGAIIYANKTMQIDTMFSI